MTFHIATRNLSGQQYEHAIICLQSFICLISVYIKKKKRNQPVLHSWRQIGEARIDRARRSDQINRVQRDIRREHWDIKCKLRTRIETTSKEEYSALMTQNKLYMSRQEGRWREREEVNQWESARVISAVPNTDPCTYRAQRWAERVTHLRSLNAAR